MNEQHIEALRQQRAAYVAAELPHRVEQVDMELRRYGVDPTAKPPKPKPTKKSTEKDES